MQQLSGASVAVGIADDVPDLDGLLAVTQHDTVRGYFNSYMADIHYHQMVAALGSGQTWFPPGLIAQALGLARNAAPAASSASIKSGTEDWAETLTAREKQLALDVAAGKSNAEIASAHSITERTVKSHLTKIFRKLDVRSRFALAVRIRGESDGIANAFNQ